MGWKPARKGPYKSSQKDEATSGTESGGSKILIVVLRNTTNKKSTTTLTRRPCGLRHCNTMNKITSIHLQWFPKHCYTDATTNSFGVKMVCFGCFCNVVSGGIERLRFFWGLFLLLCLHRRQTRGFLRGADPQVCEWWRPTF
jgi:hypothetical protein